jgi:hypothetical protein
MIFGKWIGSDLIRSGNTIATKNDVIKIHAVSVSATEYVCSSDRSSYFFARESDVECFGNADDVAIQKE